MMPVTCTYCPKTLNSLKCKDVHEREEHTFDDVLPCWPCRKFFIHQARLDSHKKSPEHVQKVRNLLPRAKSHPNAKQSDVSYKVCNKSFVSSKTLRKHQSTLSHKACVAAAAKHESESISLYSNLVEDVLTKDKVDIEGAIKSEVIMTRVSCDQIGMDDVPIEPEEDLEDQQEAESFSSSDHHDSKECLKISLHNMSLDHVPIKPEEALEEQRRADDRNDLEANCFQNGSEQSSGEETVETSTEPASTVMVVRKTPTDATANPQKFPCGPCKVSFEKHYHLKSHEETRSHLERLQALGEDVPESLFKPYKCPHCDKRYQQAYSLTRHIRMHDPQNMEREAHSAIECKICYKVLYNRYALTIHLRTHTQEKPYQCEICFRWFSRKDVLQQHWNAHGGIKNYKCETCPQAFVQLTSLKGHRKIHLQTRDFMCDKCPARYNFKQALQRHLRLHEGGEDKCHICDTCGLYLVSRLAFNQHNTRHHLCEQCKKNKKKCVCGKKVVVVKLKQE